MEGRSLGSKEQYCANIPKNHLFVIVYNYIVLSQGAFIPVESFGISKFT